MKQSSESSAALEGRLTLQVGQLLLRCLFTGYHVLDDAVDCVQDDLVVTQRQDTVDLGVQQAMTESERRRVKTKVNVDVSKRK